MSQQNPTVGGRPLDTLIRDADAAVGNPVGAACRPG